MKRSLLFVSIALLLTACLPRDVQVPQSPLLPLLERKSGLIAYVGIDGNIYTSDQAGRHLQSHTTDAVLPEDASAAFRYYLYPAWAPDGNSLAYVGVSGQGTATSSELFIANIADATSRKVFASESEHPFYLYWSPDSINLSFLSTTPTGGSMILQSVSTEAEDRTILDIGSPYYWSWAPDGRTMIVHTGSASSTTPEHLSFLQMDDPVLEDGLSESPASFQAPAWSPNGEHILSTRINDDGQKEIVVLNRRGEFEKSVGTFALNAAFAWSSDNTTVAYIEGDRDISAGTIGTMHVVDLDTGEDLFQDENVYALFWSPSGEKIAYFLPLVTEAASDQGGDGSTTQQQGQQLLLQLKVLDVKSGESRELYTFRPSDQFIQILPYFDQYHQSVTIWSPDDNNLVLSFLTTDGAPGIAIAAASGQLEPRLLAQGFLAFWSPK